MSSESSGTARISTSQGQGHKSKMLSRVVCLRLKGFLFLLAMLAYYALITGSRRTWLQKLRFTGVIDIIMGLKPVAFSGQMGVIYTPCPEKRCHLIFCH